MWPPAVRWGWYASAHRPWSGTHSTLTAAGATFHPEAGYAFEVNDLAPHGAFNGGAIRAHEGIDAASVRALHFAGPVKPWMPEAMLRWTQGDPDHKLRDAFRRWYDAYVGYLADAHVRSAGDRRRRSRGNRE